MAAVPNFQAILAASLSPDSGLRTQAEQAVAQLSVADPSTFFLELSKELRNDALEDRFRQQAGLIMKIHLDATVRPQGCSPPPPPRGRRPLPAHPPARPPPCGGGALRSTVPHRVHARLRARARGEARTLTPRR